MSKNFEAKKVVVSEIEEKIEKAESIVIVEYKALTVEAMDRMSYQGCQGIVEILKGEKPTWCVNYEEVRAMREKG